MLRERAERYVVLEVPARAGGPAVQVILRTDVLSPLDIETWRAIVASFYEAEEPGEPSAPRLALVRSTSPGGPEGGRAS